MSGNIEARTAQTAISDILFSAASIGAAESIISSINVLSSKVQSEDSNLAEAYTQYGEIVDSVSNAISVVLITLKDDWNEWCVATLKNEEEATSSVEEIKTGLDGILEAVAEITAGYEKEPIDQPESAAVGYGSRIIEP